MRRKRPNLEVMNGELLGWDSDLGGRLLTSRANVSGGNPAGSELVAIENAT